MKTFYVILFSDRRCQLHYHAFGGMPLISLKLQTQKVEILHTFRQVQPQLLGTNFFR